MSKWIVPLLAVAAAGCPNITTDPDEEGSGVFVEFDPGNRIVPFPNNLLLDRATGKVALPPQCNESPTAQALREQVVNQLDGFGAYQTAITVTFTAPVDPDSLEGRVLLYKRVDGATSATPVPVALALGTTARFDADCATSVMVDQLAIRPLEPLDQRSNYVVALERGIKTTGGLEFGSSFTWVLVRSDENPVTLDEAGNVISDRTPLDPSDPASLERLLGINLLWNAHDPALRFLDGIGRVRRDVLLAWEFRTQTTTDPLDQGVAGSPAAIVRDTGPLLDDQGTPGSVPQAVPGGGEQFLIARLPPGSCSAEGGTLPCQLVAEVMFGGLEARQFQVDKPNPFDPTKPIPGAWTDPIAPTVTRTELVRAIITVPAHACASGTNGCPTVVYGHPFNSTGSTAIAMASQLASQGFNVVAIDAVAHGARARQISSAGRCAEANLAQATHPECFAPFLSPDLGATRDNMRQSVIDVHSLVAALRACGTSNCGALRVDRFRIVYIGLSLGGFLGGVTVGSVGDIRTAVLSTGGAGWADFIENTASLAVRCLVVDGLIDAGILVGEKSSAGAGALCLGDTWKTQPGFRTFAAIGRWVLDPADAANFSGKLLARKVLYQEIVDDGVIPNVTTANAARFQNLLSLDADPAASTTLDPSTAIGGASAWVRYTTLPADGPFPGNTFEHPSLLQPSAGIPGRLGTARLQTDAIAFLLLNP